jgi:hypothetical protein
MKLVDSIKSYFGYSPAEVLKNKQYDSRPDVYDIRERLLPDVKTYNVPDGSAARCLCGFGGWTAQRDFMHGYEMRHRCFEPKHGGLHREEDFPMRNNAMLVVHRAGGK